MPGQHIPEGWHGSRGHFRLRSGCAPSHDDGFVHHRHDNHADGVRVRCCLLCIYLPAIDRSLSGCRYTLGANQDNAYALAGLVGLPLTVPAAYQCAAPFGADIGGANPQFFAIASGAATGYAEFDSWLTVGMTDVSTQATLITI